ncbi:MAG: 50S ribosomal protein L29 [Candidatus Marinimicrobia bacterium]|nr:50S ribosomal protein L29 [Candidatus Neomarinimicrobiota bacterium]
MYSDDLLSLSVDELKIQLEEQQEELTNLHFQQALQQLEGTHKITATRKVVARMKTLLHEYELGIRELKAEG